MKQTITPIEKIGDNHAGFYIAYTRKSTDDADNQKNSIEYQEQEIRRDLQRQGIEIAPITIEGFCTDGFIVEHHSGFKEDAEFETNADGTVSISVDRPKFLMLVNLLRQKKLKGVISLCWDRFSRNEADDMLTKKLLRQGIDVRFVQAQYDFFSAAGALHADVDGMFSRHYSRTISEKVRNTNRKLRAEGKCIYSPALGYLSEGSGHKPFDPERAPLIKRIFELYATGEWSIAGLVDWAACNGLTMKPARRRRTPTEKLHGVQLAEIPKFTRPITASTIWNILRNPFYIGKIKHKNQLFDSKAHQPLIDLSTFYKVQAILKEKAVKVYYPQFPFFTYRGLVKCGVCKRMYSPYEQKGISYYRTQCVKNCPNTVKNINDKFITKKVVEVLNQIHFTDDEKRQIEANAWKELHALNNGKAKQIEDLQYQKSKAVSNLEYLKSDKLNLLRTGVFSAAQLIEEEGRLNTVIAEYSEKIEKLSVSYKMMSEFVVSFSELTKHTAAYFEQALDSEKRDIVLQVFSELYIESGELKYEAKEGYRELLQRSTAHSIQSCSEDCSVLELENIYTAVMQANSAFRAFLSSKGIA